MQQSSPFTIYNASAGSGKTYTLVKSYLTTILQSEHPLKFRELLAITFTNKAVAEMKVRIIETLKAFRDYHPEHPAPPMLEAIAQTLKMTPKAVASRAESTLKSIIHNYAAFDIVTIDALTARVLRTFAKDLKLASNFEVALDVEALVAQSVDALIAKAGTDTLLTDALVTYALEKTDEDKSWNISKDLQDIGKLLTSENDREAIGTLLSKTLVDFQQLKEQLQKKQGQLRSQIEQTATDALQLIHDNQLSQEHFSGGYFYKHLLKLKEEPVDATFGNKWQEQIEAYTFYKKSEHGDIKAIIDRIKPSLITAFLSTKELVESLRFTRAVLKNCAPLSVLSLIAKEFEAIKNEENLLPITEFNNYIFKHLKDEPAPFIYERLGERYAHYFIDEFQDTSTLQWHNLVPLIENKLATATPAEEAHNSLLLVGDAKQSIYRWRGGNAEQFIALAQKNHPFSLPPEAIAVHTLECNYRSNLEIVAFNNKLFTHVANYINQPAYKDLYVSTNNQKTMHKEGGYVSITFVAANTVDEAAQQYIPLALGQIRTLVTEGFSLKDICVLTRKKSHSKDIAQALVEAGYPVISPDSLMISSSTEVQFLVNLLALIAQPKDEELQIAVLDFIAKKEQLEDPHSFFVTHLHEAGSSFFNRMEETYGFSLFTFHSLPLYEAIEYTVRCFMLDNQADAYLFGFVNAVFEFAQKNSTGLQGFLSHWSRQKDVLSIQLPEDQDAIQLMTIHKAKGLEFPVVLFPYADTPLFSAREHHWYQTNPDDYHGFSTLLIPHTAALTSYDEQIAYLYERKRLEQLFDSVNMLYVATTRPVSRLYIYSTYKAGSQVTAKSFNDLLISFLKDQGRWEDGILHYSFGTPLAPAPAGQVPSTSHLLPYLSSAKEAHNIHHITTAGFLWDLQRQEAIQYGNLIHAILERLKHRGQLPELIRELEMEGAFAKAETQKIKQILLRILAHPALKHCFLIENEIIVERPILLPSGEQLIPDRIEISHNKQATIIDYKTGTPKEADKHQINRYAHALQDMGYDASKKLLVYINDEVQVVTA